VEGANPPEPVSSLVVTRDQPQIVRDQKRKSPLAARRKKKVYILEGWGKRGVISHLPSTHHTLGEKKGGRRGMSGPKTSTNKTKG